MIHPPDSAHTLRAYDITLGYAGPPVIEHLTVEIPSGGFTVIVGPNACGKSTLLRALGRMLAPRTGQVFLGDADIRSLPTKKVARRIALLPQSPSVPEAITVADLVARGRYPHQHLLRQWSPEDEVALDQALAEVGLSDLADRLVEELSGGQRQRAWIAMTLAQQTPVLLLDEPTTYLDIAQQIDVLNLCARLHQQGRTLVAVLHDLNLAARFATHLIAMRDGRIMAEGTPEKLLRADLLREVFDLEADVIADPQTGRPMIIPRDTRTTADPQ